MTTILEKEVLSKLGPLVRHPARLTPAEEKNGLTFQAISLTSGDKKLEPKEGSTYSRSEYYVYITGIYNDKSIGIRVTNYKLFFYVSVPDRWTPTECKRFYDLFIKKRCNEVFKYEIVNKIPLYPFTHFKLVKCLKIYFNNAMSMFILNSIFQRGDAVEYSGANESDEFIVYECKVPSINKFCHEKNIKTAGYITIKNLTKKNNNTSTNIFNTQYSIDVDAADIFAAEDVPVNSNFRILSYDIECQSSTGEMTDADVPGDYVGQIGISMLSLASNVTVKIIITRGPCSPLTDADGDNVIVFPTTSETELLITYCLIIKHLDPDVITGYNIWNFDDKYIVTRMKYLQIYNNINMLARINENLQTLSYITVYRNQKTKQDKNEFRHLATAEEKVGIIKATFSSMAFRDNTFYILIMPGRETYDLLEVVKRENQKFDNHKLDTVSEFYLKEHKDGLSIEALFRYLAINDAPSNQIVAKYCIQDNNLVIKIIKKQLFIQTYIEMAKLVYVPISWLLTRGQQCRVYSLIVKFANNDNYIVPDIIAQDIEKFQGAIVLEPLRGKQFNPVCTLDFASLYPSIIRAHNLCLSTYFRPDASSAAYKGVITDNSVSGSDEVTEAVLRAVRNGEGLKFEVFSEDGLKFEKMQRTKITVNKKVGAKGKIIEEEVISDTKDYFYQPKPGEKKGPIPQILDTLTVWRKDAKNSMASATDQGTKDIYNSKQLSIKVVMNSVYGFFGSMNKIACVAIASCVTGRGRMMIQITARLAQEDYPCQILYGDSIPGCTKVYGGFSKDDLEHIPIKNMADILEQKGILWSKYKYFKTSDEKAVEDTKEQINLEGLSMYTRAGSGPCKLKRIIRHKTTKKLYEITCKDSTGKLHKVVVTEGHSLIDTNGYPVDVSSLTIGQKLPMLQE